MRIGTCITKEKDHYLNPGLEALKFERHGQDGVFLQLKMKCSACGHSQTHSSTGYLLGACRSLQGAVKEILDNIFSDREASLIACDFCGQISLLVPSFQRVHVREWVFANITEAWFAAAEYSAERPTRVIGTCIN